MPSPGKDEKQSVFIPRCIRETMDDGTTDDNKQAAAICYNKWREHVKASGGEVDGVEFEIVNDVEPINAITGASYQPGEILAFKNATLARAERNSNGDELTPTNIDQLAATLPLMPVSDEHGPRNIVGIWTAAENVADALVTSGIIYMRRFPEVAEGIMDGSKKLSIEAYADKAVCSLCGGEFVHASAYCDHLKDRRKNPSVSRRFNEVKALGGGTTTRPAGSGTTFDRSSVYVVASHTEVDENSEEEIEKKQKEKEACEAMEIEELKSQLQAALDKLAESTRRITELETAQADLQAKLTASASESETLRNTNEALRLENRKAVLASVMDQAEFEANQTIIMAMTDEAVNLLANKASKPKVVSGQPVVDLTPPKAKEKIGL